MAPPDPRRSSRLLDSLCERRASASTPTDSAVAEKAHIVRSGAEELDKRRRTWVTPTFEIGNLPTPAGTLWHGFRRKWATDRRHSPLKDVATAGGWSDVQTMITCYQQPDAEMNALWSTSQNTRPRDAAATVAEVADAFLRDGGRGLRKGPRPPSVSAVPAGSVDERDVAGLVRDRAHAALLTERDAPRVAADVDRLGQLPCLQ